jgi:Replication initiator protein, pSAM2
VTGPDWAVSPVEQAITARLRDPDYGWWREQVQSTRGCAAPIHLHGSSRVLDRDGATLLERSGTVLAPCGNRRESVCPACSDRYCADAFHLLRAGLAGDDTKGVPTTVVEHPRAFVTLTAPSFGPVHTRTVTPRGYVRPCACGDRHHGDDPRVGTALDPESYDYVGAVLWQAHAGALWARFATHLRRALAAGLGVGVRDWPQHGRLSFAKVTEYQRRGLVHFHAVVRLDGPDGPADPAPPLDHAALCAAVRDAARHTLLRAARPDGTVLPLTWGTQLDIRPVPQAAARQLENDAGEMTDAALAGYIAKYATKGTGAHEGVDRPIRDLGHLAHLRLPDHHRRMITTAWDLGDREEYAGLQLRRWAHMLGFRGHFLTKSRHYSSTFTAIRTERREHHLRTALRELDTDGDDPHPIDLTTVTVINDWWPVHHGHRDDGERELAAAIADRHRAQRHSRTTTRRAS